MILSQGYPSPIVGDYVAISAMSYPTPSPSIQDWRGLESSHPKSSQIGVDLSNKVSIGVGSSDARVAPPPSAVGFSDHDDSGDPVPLPPGCQL